ncbi:MAG: hypothetical protein KC983_03960 [Phycisphaerales bacterium]|nr:hypothetical protein [Phycisphaerales bacterium]
MFVDKQYAHRVVSPTSAMPTVFPAGRGPPAFLKAGFNTEFYRLSYRLSGDEIEGDLTDQGDKAVPNQCWRAHPACERLSRTALAVLIVLALGAATALLAGSILAGGAAVILLLLALSRYFLPSNYEITDEGITARYPFRRVHQAWRDVRRCISDGRGVYLSTRARRSRLDAYTGLHVLPGLGGSPTVDDIVRIVRSHMTGDLPA